MKKALEAALEAIRTLTTQEFISDEKTKAVGMTYALYQKKILGAMIMIPGKEPQWFSPTRIKCLLREINKEAANVR